MTDEGRNGDALARLVATSLATLLVAAILAASAHLWAVSESCASAHSELTVLHESTAQLRAALGCHSDDGDLHRLCVRLERLEQRYDMLTRAVRPEGHP
jgi:hypothetical protein